MNKNKQENNKPYFTLSKKVIFDQFDKVKDLCDVVSYSSKTNPLVTKILEEKKDCLFSVHLKNELKNIIDKKRVLFLAQALEEDFIDELMNEGINKFVIDNLEDLEILLSYLNKNKDKKIDLMLRVKLKENSIRTERYFVFGISSDIVNEKILELRKNKQINDLGVHFHRKSQNMAEWNLIEELNDMFSKETLKDIDTINIGGGLPSIYANTNEKIFDSIYKKILEFKEYINKKNIKLMIEPGRFIAAPAGKLHSKIIQIYENNIILNVSVYNTDMDALIVPVKLLVKGELNQNDENAKPFVIKGKTPCSMDLFRYRVYLNNPKKNDEIVFLNAGAYNFTTDFCDLEKLEQIIVD
ncbi:MAG: decarboxylase [Candidatus Nanoarchaeia archaeon]|nr:decarboxylase [Candidatus Nanoarchaeia archaeon]